MIGCSSITIAFFFFLIVALAMYRKYYRYWNTWCLRRYKLYGSDRLIANSSNLNLIWPSLWWNLAFLIYLYSLYYIFILTYFFHGDWLGLSYNFSSCRMLYGAKDKSQRTERQYSIKYIVYTINLNLNPLLWIKL